MRRRSPHQGNSLRSLILTATVAASLSACSPSATTPTSQPVLPAATATPTLEFPTLIPTPSEGAPETLENLPLLGEPGDLVYSTRFEQSGEWPEVDDAFGAVSYLGQHLSIVVSFAGTTRYVPSPAPAQRDFRLEAELSAIVCSDNDEYGLAFRHSPEGDHYRLTITCNGGVRLRRVTAGSSRAVVPFVESSAAVRAGAPATNRLTIVAVAQDMTVWVNNSPVLSVQDPSPIAGGSGLIVTSSPTSPQTTVQANSFVLYTASSDAAPATETPNG